MTDAPIIVEEKPKAKLWQIIATVLLVSFGARAGVALLLHALHPAAAGPRFSLIAVSASSLRYGSSWNCANMLAARDRALSEYQQRTDKPDCEVKVTMNDDCGALALSPARGFATVASDASKSRAGDATLAECKASGASDCAVIENYCANRS